MNITVYLGASNGNDQNLILAARKLGKWIGENLFMEALNVV